MAWVQERSRHTRAHALVRQSPPTATSKTLGWIHNTKTQAAHSERVRKCIEGTERRSRLSPLWRAHELCQVTSVPWDAAEA